MTAAVVRLGTDARFWTASNIVFSANTGVAP